MADFPIPTRDDVAPANAAIFDQLKGQLGMVPNLYATLAHSDTALGTYLALQSAKSSIKAKDREIVNLVTSQANECDYCLAAHTALGKMNGFTDAQILELRTGRASWDAKSDALAVFVRALVETRGKPDPEVTDAFLAAGWTRANLVDVIVTVGDKIVTNYLHGVTGVAIDFPKAPQLEQPVAAE